MNKYNIKPGDIIAHYFGIEHDRLEYMFILNCSYFPFIQASPRIRLLYWNDYGIARQTTPKINDFDPCIILDNEGNLLEGFFKLTGKRN